MNAELYDALLDAGVADTKAHAAATSFLSASELATKTDFFQLKADLA